LYFAMRWLRPDLDGVDRDVRRRLDDSHQCCAKIVVRTARGGL
jgi:hypothetical protein